MAGVAIACMLAAGSIAEADWSPSWESQWHNRAVVDDLWRAYSERTGAVAYTSGNLPQPTSIWHNATWFVRYTNALREIAPRYANHTIPDNPTTGGVIRAWTWTGLLAHAQYPTSPPSLWHYVATPQAARRVVTNLLYSIEPLAYDVGELTNAISITIDYAGLVSTNTATQAGPAPSAFVRAVLDLPSQVYEYTYFRRVQYLTITNAIATNTPWTARLYSLPAESASRPGDAPFITAFAVYTNAAGADVASNQYARWRVNVLNLHGDAAPTGLLYHAWLDTSSTNWTRVGSIWRTLQTFGGPLGFDIPNIFTRWDDDFDPDLSPIVIPATTGTAAIARIDYSEVAQALGQTNWITPYLDSYEYFEDAAQGYEYVGDSTAIIEHEFRYR